MLEDILEESRKDELKRKYNKSTRRLWIVIIILGFINVVGLPYVYFGRDEGEIVQSSITSIIFGFPILSIILASVISIIPIKNWPYSRRLYRVAQIIFIIIMGIITLAVIPMLILKLSGVEIK